MAKHPLTQASNITTEVVLQIGKLYSSTELRGVQAKLTGTAREIRKLTADSGLLGRLGDNLDLEQRQLLRDAAQLIDSVNQHIEHAKEKKKRSEQEAKRRQDARNSRAKQLIASEYPLPCQTQDELLHILTIALTFNRAQVFASFYLPQLFNHRLREQLLTPKSRLIGRESPKTFFASCVGSLRCDLIQELQSEISYDDGSSVEERLEAIKRKVKDCLSQTPLTTEEQETLRLWSEALTPPAKAGGQA